MQALYLGPRDCNHLQIQMLHRSNMAFTISGSATLRAVFPVPWRRALVRRLRNLLRTPLPPPSLRTPPSALPRGISLQCPSAPARASAIPRPTPISKRAPHTPPPPPHPPPPPPPPGPPPPPPPPPPI